MERALGEVFHCVGQITDDLSPLDDLDGSGKICMDVVQVTRWEPYDLYELAHVFWLGSVLYIYRSSVISYNGRHGM